MHVNVLDLFAGSGGFSLGFELENFNVDTHIEMDEYASDTLRNNFPNSRVLTEDIRFVDPVSLAEDADFDVIIGGPPCQGFSVAGSTQFGVEDVRNELIFWYLHFIQKIKPKIAILENVPNVLSKKSKDGESFLSIITKIGQEIGYQVSCKILNSVDYGVPQSRRRAFVVFHLNGTKFDFPEITHSNNNDKQLSFCTYQKQVSVGEALGDLPLVEAGEKGSGLPYKQPPKNKYQNYCREISSVITNHDPMRHTARLVERFKIIKQGQSLKDAPIEYGQIKYGTGELVSKPFKYNNYRLDKCKPSLAIPASFQSLFIHPYMHRNLTAREGARLMSFPDWYEFKGPKTMMSWESGLSQYNQIGNAVCPLLSKAIAKSVKSYLNSITGIAINLQQSKTLSSIYKTLDTSRYTIDDAKQGRSIFLSNLKQANFDLYKESQFYDSCTEHFSVKGVDVDLKTVFYAHQLLIAENCPICNPNKNPKGNHVGQMNLLISKSDLKSLLVKQKDHGLDFHLRILTESNHKVTNAVALILEDIGLVSILSIPNPRTGKKVKSISLLSTRGLYQISDSIMTIINAHDDSVLSSKSAQ